MGRFTTITRTEHVKATPLDVLGLISTTEGFTSINPHRTADPQLEIVPIGPASGVGSGFRFRGKDGKGVQTISEITDRTVSYAIDMGAMGKSVQKISAVAAQSGGSTVEWSMTLDAGRSPLLRIFGLVAPRILGPTLETGLKNLTVHAKFTELS